ncbi:MAG: 2-oxo acid dehydrogenase subunit E2, partial [Alphaproteobacteria bacterium]|nr:2-oxo acid dehydrogenase subunit E2 [Alphaproteobacteria bacterium]
SLMRKTVAQRLSDSKRNIPHFYVTMDFELDALLALRAQINASLTDAKISVNDMLIKACAQALKDTPDANVTWHDTFIRYHKTVDISVAVAIEGGLITPIIFGVEHKNLTTIAQSVKHVVTKARAGQLKPHEYEGGTFTISNLGMYGVDQFAAILNPPQGCILAVGAGKKRPVVRNDALAVATVMTATLSVDHRSIDGALAAQVLERIKHYVENPVLMMI